MIYSDLIDLLDRKYSYLIKSNKKTFMIDLSDFTIFLFENELIKDFSMKLLHEFSKRKEEYNKIILDEIEDLKSISSKIRKKYPELNNGKSKSNLNPDNRDYFNSFSYFDDIITGDYENKSFPMFPELLDDFTKSKPLFDVIQNKITIYERDHEEKEDKKFDKKLLDQFFKLKKNHDYKFKEWINYQRTSGGRALFDLINIVEKINPEPDKLNESLFEWFVRSFKDNHFYGWVQDLTYGVISQYANYKPAGLSDDEVDQQIVELINLTSRVYENIRQNIGITLYKKQILEKYKTRCICYDNIRDLVIENNKFIKNREEILTIHLSKFLFDNGISTFYKLKRGQHEFDIFDPNSKNPMIIEIKVYKDSRSKQYLINGLYQLHSYLNSVQSQWNISEGYYIIYRLGGPIYEFPEDITFNKYKIHIFLIDVGKSIESGSKQPKPIMINEENIIRKLKD